MIKLGRNALVRSVVHAWPAPWRRLLERSARGDLPRALYRKAVAHELAQPLFPDGVMLRCGPFDFVVPAEVGADYCHFEPLSQQAFLDAVQPGMTVLDVGANVGYYTLLAASRVGEGGRVHAVEPFEGNVAVLTHNLERAAVRNVTVHRWAAGEQQRQRTFHVTDSSIDHGFYPHPVAETVRTVQVTEMPVDDFISAPVQVAKVDVEGAEIEVLNGMRRLLEMSRPLTLFVEWSPRCMGNAGREPEELPAKLAELGFEEVTVLDDLAGRRRELAEVESAMRAHELPRDWYANLLAVRR